LIQINSKCDSKSSTDWIYCITDTYDTKFWSQYCHLVSRYRVVSIVLHSTSSLFTTGWEVTGVPCSASGLNFHPAPYWTVFISYVLVLLLSWYIQVTPFWHLNFAAVPTCVYPDLPCEFSYVIQLSQCEKKQYVALTWVLIHCNSVGRLQ